MDEEGLIGKKEIWILIKDGKYKVPQGGKRVGTETEVIKHISDKRGLLGEDVFRYAIFEVPDEEPVEEEPKPKRGK